MTQPHQMAVVVQRMVPAEMAGVLFTADPITGSYAAMTGNFTFGLGERLVSGEADAHAFTLARPTGTYTGQPALQSSAKKLFKLATNSKRSSARPKTSSGLWPEANSICCRRDRSPP